MASCSKKSRQSNTSNGRSVFRSISQAFPHYGPVDMGTITKVPISKARVISLITFSWLTPVMMCIYKKGIVSVLGLQWWEEDTAEANVNLLSEYWKKEMEERGTEKASLGRAIRKAYSSRIICSLLSVLFSLTFSFVAYAGILRLLLDHVASVKSDIVEGCVIVTSLIVCELCRSLSYSLTWALNYWNGVRVRSAIMGLFYRKITKLRSLHDKKIGELVNMCSNDGQRLFEVMANGPFVIGGPVVFLAGSIYLGFLIGVWALIGCATYVMFFIILKFVAGWTEKFRSEAIQHTGDRVGLMTEILTCMKLIKMNAWETAFTNRINCKRKKEKSVLEKALFLQSVMTSLVPMMPVLASVFIFLAYILSGNNLTASQAFTLVSVLYAMSFSLALMMHGVRTLSEASVAVSRYKEILLMDEIIEHKKIEDDDIAILIKDACLSWDAPQEEYLECEDSVTNAVLVDDVPYINNSMTTYSTRDEEDGENNDDYDDDVFDEERALCELKREGSKIDLYDIDITIKKGNLVGICGMKGSGKSSLLGALLGRMDFKSGSIGVNGSVAYLSQEPWIINATAQENILFGKPLQPDRYKTIIEACHLNDDFETFGASDKVEIGDRGITLSGGQKQRICLARALYSNSDIYLLDDPLSALDIIIGRHVFHQCIRKILKDKTVLFVTHHLEYLISCDKVIRMQSGRIAEMGTHKELVMAGKDYFELFNLYQSKYEDIKRERIKSAIHREDRKSVQHGFSKKELLRALSHISIKEGLQKQYSIMSSTSVTAAALGDYDYIDIDDLVAAQQSSENQLPKKVFHSYIKAAGGYIVVILVLIVFIFSIGLQTGANWWLAHWLSQSEQNISRNSSEVVYTRNIADDPNVHIYSLVYGLFVVCMIIAVVLRGLLFVKLLLRAASQLHKRVLVQTMKCPMKFFDTTPIGIILNRFSADMDELDVRLPTNCEMFLQNVFLVFFALAMICYIYPWDLLAVLPLAILFIILALMFAPTLQQLKYVDNVTRAPFLSHLATTVEGISTIHTLGQADRFSKQ
ncbi:ATP-binding cassette sub-family C member 5 isoform X2 [Patella vulgata]|nr:ATP-binding cassette sub-family C member 5 isoform X2 [Patella vulgata]